MNLALLVQGMRLKTLPAAVVPPVLALAIYFSEHQLVPISFFYCLFLALFLQIATNFYNDGLDALKGADDERVGPSRLATQENINPRVILRWGHVFLILAICFAIPICIQGGAVFWVLGVICAYLAYGYTGGPFPLAYLGLGELFVFIFFGLVATLGSFFLMTSELTFVSFLIACCVGFLSCSLIAINNYRDKETDRKVNKKTLATRLSADKYLLIMDIFLFAPYVLAMYLTVFMKLSYFFPFLAIGFAHKIRTKMRNFQHPSELNESLALAGKQLVVYGVLMAIGIIWNSSPI